MKSFRLLSLSAALVSSLAAPATPACDSCALYFAGGADRPGFSLAVAHQFTRLGRVWQDDRQLGNPVDQFLDSSITQVALGYARGGPVRFQFTVPYVSRSYRRPDHALIESGRIRGLGDAVLAAQWHAWRLTTARGDEFTAKLLGGVKLATGDDTHLGDEVGHHFHHHAGLPDSGVHGHDLALGSGSTDGLLGADAEWRHQRVFLRASLQYKLRRPGAFDYRVADETSWEAGAGWYLALTHRRTLAVQALWAAEHKGLDTLAGDPQEDTGISVRYLGARVTATLGQRFTADASAELPVHIRTSETMVVPDYRLRAAATWRF